MCKPIEKRETKLVIRSDTKFVPMLHHLKGVAGERRLACESYRCVTISLDTCPNEDIEANPDKLIGKWRLSGRTALGTSKRRKNGGR